MSSAALIAMGFVALGMVLTPGPNTVYLVSRSISQGRSAGLVSLAGTGRFVAYVTMANPGRAAIFLIVPWLYIGLKAVGVVYLGYLPGEPFGQVVTAFSRPAASSATRAEALSNGLGDQPPEPEGCRHVPGADPTVHRPGPGSTTAQGFTLGTIQSAVSLTVDALIVLLAGSIAALTRQPKWAAWQRRVTGSLLGLVTVTLATDVPQRARV